MASDAAAAAAEYKSKCARVWSEGAGTYASQVHEGSKIIMPLAKHLTDIVTSTLRDKEAGTAVLDIASGSGEPALSIAKALPRAAVTATDLAPGMVAEAQQRGKGLPNFRAEVADAEDLAAFGDDAFDAVTCCAGIMFLPDRNRALREWRRVTKPGGLLIIAMPGPVGLESTQWIGLFSGAMAKVAPGEKPMVNPNTFGDAAGLAGDVAAAGFQDVVIGNCNVPMDVKEDAIADCFLSNPMAAEMLQRLREAGRPDIGEEMMAALKELAQERGFLQPGGGIICPINSFIVVTARS